MTIWAEIPWLGDDQPVAQHRVLAHRQQKRRIGVEAVVAPAQRGRKV